MEIIAANNYRKSDNYKELYYSHLHSCIQYENYSHKFDN